MTLNAKAIKKTSRESPFDDCSPFCRTARKAACLPRCVNRLANVLRHAAAHAKNAGRLSDAINPCLIRSKLDGWPTQLLPRFPGFWHVASPVVILSESVLS
jgi:hypothetical protein